MDEQTCQGIKRNFLEAVKVLDLPSSEQIRVTEPACVTCELYEDFIGSYQSFLECYKSTLSEFQRQQLQIISDTLEAMPDESFVCFDNSVLEKESWMKLRQVTTTAILELGWELETPKEYKEIENGGWRRE